MAEPTLPSFTTLLGAFAESAITGQLELDVHLNQHQGDNSETTSLTGSVYRVSALRVDVAVMVSTARTISARIGVWPLNIGASVLHGWRHEDANRLRFEIVQVPMQSRLD